MSAYFYLACSDCEKSICLGKSISKGDVLKIQGLYSECERIWKGDVETWGAVQMFIFDHMGHHLIFDTDERNGDLDCYQQVEFDELNNRFMSGEFGIK